MLLQLLLVVAIIAVAIIAVRSLSGDKSLAVKRILAILGAMFAIVSILFPQFLSMIANFFGVGRGADLLLYMLVIAGLFFAVATVRAKARTDARVTDLARAVALMEARLLDEPGSQRDLHR